MGQCACGRIHRDHPIVPAPRLISLWQISRRCALQPSQSPKNSSQKSAADLYVDGSLVSVTFVSCDYPIAEEDPCPCIEAKQAPPDDDHSSRSLAAHLPTRAAHSLPVLAQSMGQHMSWIDSMHNTSVWPQNHHYRTMFEGGGACHTTTQPGRESVRHPRQSNQNKPPGQPGASLEPSQAFTSHFRDGFRPELCIIDRLTQLFRVCARIQSSWGRIDPLCTRPCGSRPGNDAGGGESRWVVTSTWSMLFNGALMGLSVSIHFQPYH